jgi:hypothetical protein
MLPLASSMAVKLVDTKQASRSYLVGYGHFAIDKHVSTVALVVHSTCTLFLMYLFLHLATSATFAVTAVLLQLQTTRDDYIVAHPDRLQLLRNMGVEFSTATAAAALETSASDVDTSDAAFEEVFEALAVSALHTVRSRVLSHCRVVSALMS